MLAPGLLTGQLASKAGTPHTALGDGWRQSTDLLVTGVGDDGGFHVYVAREKDAFRWSTLATLTLPGWDSGPWTGYTCLTGSGRYAVAVYAPSFAVNRPGLVEAGAFASVIDTTNGAVRPVASGVTLQYFSPSCDAGDDVLLTRAHGAMRTPAMKL